MFHYLWQKFTVWKYSLLVNEILKLGKRVASLGDDQLREWTRNIKSQLDSLGKNKILTSIPDSVLIETYAITKEVIFRKIGLSLFPTQLFGGIVLHYGNIAQMNTGEGKTLTSILPICLNALMQNTVYVVTVNEYLASRDYQISKPILDFFSVSSAVSLAAFDVEEKKKTHENHQVIYTTGSQLGFDYLNNNLVKKKSQKISLKFDYVIIDEVDSILIDESRNPLIISKRSRNLDSEQEEEYKKAFQLAKSLEPMSDYVIEKKESLVYLTEKGIAKAEKFYAIKNLSASVNHLQNFLLLNSLRAIELYNKGIQYIVDNEKKKIVIIDGLTGRLVPNRVYGSGIHQAVEAKEELPLTPHGKSTATITYQNFFRLFRRIAGMTGTAESESEEFRQIYGMEVIVVESYRKSIRKDNGDLIFFDKRSKYEAVIRVIRENYRGSKRPVLIGSPSLEVSQYFSKLLKLLRIKHSRLNAVNHYEEAQVIKKAGEVGQLTISTNMAGRGTDIILTQESIERGGLLLIGLERNHIRRIDDQLRGRAGRQGSPGTTQFYVSLEDDLLKNYNLHERIRSFISPEQLGELTSNGISHRIFDLLISEPQEATKNIESSNRTYNLNYDIVINKQRNLIYEYRESIVDSDDLPELLLSVEGNSLISEVMLFSLLHEKTKREILSRIDEFWSGYLECLEKIRGTANLRVYSFQDPQDFYFLESNRLFYENYLRIQEENRKETEKLVKRFSSLYQLVEETRKKFSLDSETS